MGSDNMKLIVGLGNPGSNYNNTRHNIGFDVIDCYLKYKGIKPLWKKNFNGLFIKSKIYNEDVIFLKPQTFMNLSGNSVRKIVDYYKIDIDDILIISDDLDLNIGNYKLKKSGSCGGHNGLRDIEKKLNSDHYKRLKIGISNNKELETKDYVLGLLSKNEKKVLLNLYDKLFLILDDYFIVTFDELMNKYNQKNR